MDPAYYVAAGSLKARSFQLETLSNNLANSATVGYKTERSFFSVFNKAKGSTRNLPLTPFVNDGTVLAQRGLDFSQGPAKATGRNLDFMIEGNGFFMVQTPQGTMATRDGRFQVSANGALQALDGSPVLGKNGPIMLKNVNGTLTASPDGGLYQGQELVGDLDMRAFQNTIDLQRIGSNRYDPAGMQNAPLKAKVTQGYLEQSGADVASTMIDMINLNRLFEMSLKVASTISNELDSRSINDIAAPR